MPIDIKALQDLPFDDQLRRLAASDTASVDVRVLAHTLGWRADQVDRFIDATASTTFAPHQENALNVQAYGLAGLVALHGATHDATRLTAVRATQLVQVTTDNTRNPAESVLTSYVDGLRRDAPLSDLASILTKLTAAKAINSPDSMGLTALMHAAAMGRRDVALWLTQHGADAAKKNPQTGATVMHYAAMAHDGGAGVIQDLLEREPSFSRLLNHRQPPNGHTVAMEAIFHGNEKVIRFLLALRDKGVDVDLVTPAVTGWGPRTFAEREGMSFAALLPPSSVARDDRVRWSAQQNEQWLSSLPLAEQQEARRGVDFIAAVQAFDVERVRELVRAGVNVNGRYGWLGATALNALFMNPMTDTERASAMAMLRALLDLGADPRVPETGLMLVHAGFREASYGYAAALEQLGENVRARYGDVALRAWLDARGPMNGYAKIIDAAQFGHRDVVVTLLALGADPRVTGFNGVTAEKAARRWNETADPSSRFSDELLKALAKGR